ncbi:signal peptidase I [Alkalicoccus halolimnae]|uniref:Signal peptidase I n=1 Tax=Alkalicoccus halolimnae TaxID=1667239 RepID=A0A5C7FAR5_9BACI|nr:signal peptidase I [Alkalicoccus halolimnae]TXF86620.1 signal peptidase I [Alkalicoccus halolimnae]
MREPKKSGSGKKLWRRGIWRIIQTAAIVLVLTFIVREFMFTNYIVYGQSMLPTIKDGERIIVNKIGYELTEPDRFDLIIFHADEDSDYIKRIIGLPGDELYYEADTLYVNGESVEEDFLETISVNGSDVFTDDFTLENLTDEHTVPEGHVFVLGDNRKNSVDSRQIGFIPTDEIVGRANITFWPPQNIRFID